MFSFCPNKLIVALGIIDKEKGCGGRCFEFGNMLLSEILVDANANRCSRYADWCFSDFACRLPTPFSIIISAAVFAGAHLTPGEFPQLFVLGIFLAQEFVPY